MKKKEDTSSYTEEEVVRAVEVFRMLKEKRDQLIKAGLWNPVNNEQSDSGQPKIEDGTSDDSSK